jgi:hypothetical protein
MSEAVRSILEEVGYNLIDAGREYRAKPLYRDSDNDSVLRIWKDSGKWVDFKENKSGSLEDLIQITLKLKDVQEAKEWISSKWSKPDEERPPKKKAILSGNQVYDKSLLLKLRRDCSYWENRGISKKTLEPLEGGVATTGKMYNRYTFPIFNNKNDIIGFSGRDINPTRSDKRPKWKHIGNKRSWAYPLKVNLKEIKAKKEIILVESIGDMLALRENNINTAVVTFGLTLSARLLYCLIGLNPERVVIAFNNDENNNFAGNEAASFAKKKLSNYFDQNQLHISLPCGHKDFGDMNISNQKDILKWYSNI